MNAFARYRDWGLLVACDFIWGSQFALYKIVAKQVGPVSAVLLPTVCATLLLIPLVKYEKRRKGPASHQGRMGRPEEVAKAVAFLASEGACYITGASIRVDGGFSLKF